MKSLADQLRDSMVKPGPKAAGETQNPGIKASKQVIKKTDKAIESVMLKALIAYDNSNNKSVVHARFDKQTVDIMNKFKMATNVDITKFVAFAVRHFLESYPELKTIIKQFIQNTEL